MNTGYLYPSKARSTMVACAFVVATPFSKGRQVCFDVDLAEPYQPSGLVGFGRAVRISWRVTLMVSAHPPVDSRHL
jgi:hypothetical protein